MCLLVHYAAGAEIDTDALVTASQRNSDGFGWALVTPGGREIISGHGMNAPRVIDQFADTYSKFPGAVAMFHCRLATAGYIDTSNCHPFVVGNDPRTMVGHNGVLPAESQPRSIKDGRSDTAIFAEQIMPRRFPALDSPRTRRRLEKWLEGDKLVVLTTNPIYERHVYLFNEEAGHWIDGTWYSNYSYVPFRYTWSGPVGWVETKAGWQREPDTSTTTLGPAWLPDGARSHAWSGVDPDAKCYNCGNISIDLMGQFCVECWSCQDCRGLLDGSCSCHFGSRPATEAIEATEAG